MTIPAIALQADTRILAITWPDGESHDYHFVWLRHNARCADGMPNDTSVKIDLLPDDPASLRVDAYRVEDGILLLQWHDDALETRHNLEVLRHSAYDEAARRRRKHQPLLWDRERAAEIPEFGYRDLDTDRGRLDLLLAVRDYGLAKMHDVPTEPGSVASVAASFGPMHVNNYGGVFDVRSDARRNLGSNTGHYLPPHTDESYRHDAPGISFFHCLESNVAGGESILVDGFMAAQLLRETDPDAFAVLSSVPVFFQRLARPDEDMRSHTRVLVTDIDGDVVGLRWTDRTLPPQDLPAALVEPVYRALRSLWKIVNSEQLNYRYRLQPGNLHVFDNHRVLHGRQAFDPASGERHLQQCSVNRDEFHNSLRLLAARLEPAASDLVMAGGALG